MLKRVAKAAAALFLAVAAFSAMAAGFKVLSGLGPMDVSKKHNMQRHLVARPYEVGDILEVPSAGGDASLLCDIEPTVGRRLDTAIEATYYNEFEHAVFGFAVVVRTVKDALGSALGMNTGDVTDFAPPTLPFRGRMSEIEGDFREKMNPNCLCDVARAMLEDGNNVCVVKKALIDDGSSGADAADPHLGSTLAVSFRNVPFEINDTDALRALCPKLSVNFEPPVEQDCSQEAGFSPDVEARSLIGLIRVMALRHDPGPTPQEIARQ